MGAAGHSPENYGRAFEHFIILETRAYLAYKNIDEPLSFWRSRSGFEVDLLISDRIGVEIKATQLVTDKHLKGMRALKEEINFSRAIVVSHDRERRITSDGIEILPWKLFLDELWKGELLK